MWRTTLLARDGFIDQSKALVLFLLVATKRFLDLSSKSMF